MTALNSGAVDLVMHLTVAQTQNLSDQYTVLEGTMNLVQALYLNNAEKSLSMMCACAKPCAMQWMWTASWS